MQQSEAGKQARDKEGVNYSVAPGRSGTSSFLPRSLMRKSKANGLWVYRWGGLVDNDGR